MHPDSRIPNAVPPTTFSTSIGTREDLIEALCAAAELEHAVMCQYLFAAFSMKRHPSEGGVSWVQLEHMREWQATLLLVARQEMEHLGIVCNLLTSIGGTPHFGRRRFPHSSALCPSVGCLTLTPFGVEAVARFMEIEKGHSTMTEECSSESTATVGDVYRKILDAFERLNESSPYLFIGPKQMQVINSTIDLRPGQYDMELCLVHNIETARGAIEQVMESSDGPPDENPDSHYMRFKRVHDELDGMLESDREFRPARYVGHNPVVHSTLDSRSDVTSIDHDIARKTVLLFNDAYETMLLMLGRFYSPSAETPQERTVIKNIVFFPMMTSVLRPLGEILTCMPAHKDRTDVAAGPSFEIRGEVSLPVHKESGWMRLHERLKGMDSLCSEILLAVSDDCSPWADAVRDRLTFLGENFSLLVANFARYMNLTDLQRRFMLERVLDDH